jgi:Fe-S cluster assembly protein SufD
MQSTIDYLSSYYKNNFIDSDFANKVRQEAFQRFLERGMPSRKDESWRYANIPGWYKNHLKPPQHNDDFNLQSDYLRSKPDIIIVDGSVQILTDNIGIDIMSLQDAIITYPDKVESYIKNIQQNNNTNNPFVDFNSAAWSSGLFITIPENFSREESLKIVYMNTEEFFLNSLNIIEVGKNSRVNIAEYCYGYNSKSYNLNIVNNVYLAENSSLVHEKIQQDSIAAISQNFTNVKQAATSSYKKRQYNFGAKVYRDEIVIDFNGENAEAEFIGVDFSSKDAWHATNVKVNHNASNCTSRQQFRSLVASTSTCSFLGYIYVPKNIEATEAYQDSKSLLLGETARSNVKPYLEIFADDVICTHSATIGNLDENSLFYLRARGFSEPAAYSILIEAFVQQLLDLCICNDVKLEAKQAMNKISSSIFLEGSYE